MSFLLPVAETLGGGEAASVGAAESGAVSAGAEGAEASMSGHTPNFQKGTTDHENPPKPHGVTTGSIMGSIGTNV